MKKPKEDYYRCIDPDCTHYIQKDFLEGKRVSCPCGEEFVLTREDLRLKNPHCVYCGKNPQSRLEIQTSLEDEDDFEPEMFEQEQEQNWKGPL